MPALPSGDASSLGTLLQGMFNEAANQRSTGLALRNVIYEKRRDRSNRFMQALEVVRQHELRRKAQHEKTKAAEGALIGAGVGAVTGGLVGGVPGAFFGGGIGTGTGLLAAGEPAGAGVLASSLMRTPGALQQQRLGNQLFDIRQSQQGLDATFAPLERAQGVIQAGQSITRDRLGLNLMTDLVANPGYAGGEQM